MQDSFGRQIDYLRVSLTDRCNFRCVYCMPEEGVTSLSHFDILRIEEFEHIIRVLASEGIKRVRLTGGEPLVRKGCVDLVRAIAETPGIEDVSLTTNGVLLPRFARDLKDAGLKRVNISLDTLDAGQFHMITRCGRIEDTLAGIETALEMDFTPVKVNAVAVRSLNQDFYAFARLSVDRPLHVRFIEYMPVGSDNGISGDWGPEDVIPASEIIERINAGTRAHGEHPLVPCGEDDRPDGAGPANYWEFPGAKGTVGVISAMSNHFCSSCNRMRLTADGKLRPCLFSDQEYDMRSAVREGTDSDIRAVFEQALGNKPDEHHHRVGTQRKMSQIGG